MLLMRNSILKRFSKLRDFNHRNLFGRFDFLLSKYVIAILFFIRPICFTSPKQLNLTSANESLLMDSMDIFRSNGFEFIINKDGSLYSTILIFCETLNLILPLNRGSDETSPPQCRSYEWQLAAWSERH